MQRYIAAFGISSFLFLFAAMVMPIFAANLDFAPDSLSTDPDSTFTVDVTVDAGSEQIAGTDVYVIYDPQFVSLQAVTAGSFFPKTSNLPTSGRLYISGVIENSGEYKTGQGIVATLTFKALKDGNTTISYDCNLANTETSKIVKNDINATNIINCGGNGSLILSIGNASNSSSSTTTIPQQLPQSGVYENVLKYSIPGMLLLFVGVALRLVVR